MHLRSVLGLRGRADWPAIELSAAVEEGSYGPSLGQQGCGFRQLQDSEGASHALRARLTQPKGIAMNLNTLRWKVIGLAQRHPLRAVAGALVVGAVIARLF